jgi:hypothetical protein
MAETCAGKKHAIVKIYAGGKTPVSVYVPDPPVAVSERMIPGMNGGQCKCILYNVEFRMTYTDHTAWGSYPGQRYDTSFGAAGAIDNFRSTQDGENIRFYVTTDINCPQGNPGVEQNFSNFIWVNYRFGIWREITSMSFFFYRQDGQADNCGSSPDKCELIIKGSKNLPRYKNQYINKCPAYDVRCDDDCPEGMHKEPNGKCCCDNSDKLQQLAKSIRADIKRMK